MSSTAPLERITQTILVVRGYRVIFDADLTDLLWRHALQGCWRLCSATHNRFPVDFMFQLDKRRLQT